MPRKAGAEIGLPILGLPESLGGIAEERSAMAGTLVAETLATGDLGLAVALLAPGSVATAIGLWGTDAQQQTYLPAFTGADVPVAALALAEPAVLFDAMSPANRGRTDALVPAASPGGSLRISRAGGITGAVMTPESWTRLVRLKRRPQRPQRAVDRVLASVRRSTRSR